MVFAAVAPSAPPHGRGGEVLFPVRMTGEDGRNRKSRGMDARQKARGRRRVVFAAVACEPSKQYISASLSIIGIQILGSKAVFFTFENFDYRKCRVNQRRNREVIRTHATVSFDGLVFARRYIVSARGMIPTTKPRGRSPHPPPPCSFRFS